MRNTANRHLPCPNRSQRSGFTLIELLVVIAIIALLVSILLPSLQQAKELAKRLQCQSLLKGLGTGFNFYYEDHGMFPLFYDSLQDSGYPNFWGKTGKRWYLMFEPYDMKYVSRLEREGATSTDPFDPNIDWTTRQYHCPSWEIPAQYNDYACCYGYNRMFYAGAGTVGGAYYTFEYLKEPPANTAIVGDTVAASIIESPAEALDFSEPSFAPGFRHAGDTATFMFADTHVEVKTYAETPLETSDISGFWDPGSEGVVDDD